MAQMIPAKMEEDNDSFGERQVFKALEKLPDEYTVFHSLRWNDRSRKKKLYTENPILRYFTLERVSSS